ncbi:uncharacterized protein METZ01_LOCUS203087, partial [marine metagenome]
FLCDAPSADTILVALGKLNFEFFVPL